MKCPTCSAEMLYLGHFPHFEDGRKLKDTYACVAHKPATTIRKDIVPWPTTATS